MDITELYHFLFETIPGIGVLVGAGIVISLLLCVVFEARTRKLYRNHAEEDDVDEWELLEDMSEAEAEEEAKLHDERD
ncbi:DUF6724 family protein [Adlercreutzia murintestinalis]|uniref:DUF6724 family protein n=1 Tax=Adlercreutzia murintestinalis TaxID=2941325 RepID=UPI00203B1982|nr:DUF6724 family protein [Adlercreutzia murintestinalis]